MSKKQLLFIDLSTTFRCRFGGRATGKIVFLFLLSSENGLRLARTRVNFAKNIITVEKIAKKKTVNVK